MFNLFKNKKETPLLLFYKNRSKEDKIAILITMKYLAQCDTARQYHEFEIAYVNYYANQLDISKSEIKEEYLNNSNKYIGLISNFMGYEKAMVVFLLRTLMNIDNPANSMEIAVFQLMCEQWEFDIDIFYNDCMPEEKNAINKTLKEVIFPNGVKDVEEGALVIENLFQIAPTNISAKNYYIALQIFFETEECCQIEDLVHKIKELKLIPKKNEDIELAFRFLRGRTKKRLLNN